jgi:mono/diheme cytochrome c family protein
MLHRSHLIIALAFAVLSAFHVTAEEATPSSAELGYKFLTETAVLPADFDQKTFDALWKVWPEPLRSRAAAANVQERRRMAFQRYGLTPRPDNDSGKPLQYVVGKDGSWTMNCFSCHGGAVYGEPYPGAPNNRYALQTLTEEIGKTKLLLGKLPGRMELGAMFIPLGTTNGTTNAVVFGMGLMNGRDSELNVVRRAPKFFTHHDMDAPPWWHFSKRPYLYIDGFAEKGHRGLMQFTMVPENDAEFFRRHESDFKNVFAYISSLTPPKYALPIDRDLAERGRAVFTSNCSECHGTYGGDAEYPNRRIPIEEVGTDPVRLKALTVEGRRKYANSWFARNESGERQDTIVDPDGYVAPPLDGVWASAPYFHNGSVPTLWHVLHPEQRPGVWRPVSQEFDAERVGLTIETVESVPTDINDKVVLRSYFDCGKFGKSNRGHDFPSRLSESEKRAVLEYLKTL